MSKYWKKKLDLFSSFPHLKKKEDKRIINMEVLFIYPGFLLYRLCYSMVPAIFYKNPGVQIEFLIVLTLGYVMILAKLKT